MTLAQRLTEIIDLAAQSVAPQEQELLNDFARLYFRHLAKDDAKSLSNRQLSGALLTHFELLKQYDKTAPMIRVFNPVEEEDGFSSTHTVVELVVKNRPFLIDTLLLTLHRAEIAMHYFWHTIIDASFQEGHLAMIAEVERSDEQHLSVIYCEIERLPEVQNRLEVAQLLKDKIAQLDLVIGDWGAMEMQLREIKSQFKAQVEAQQSLELLMRLRILRHF